MSQERDAIRYYGYLRLFKVILWEECESWNELQPATRDFYTQQVGKILVRPPEKFSMKWTVSLYDKWFSGMSRDVDHLLTSGEISEEDAERIDQDWTVISTAWERWSAFLGREERHYVPSFTVRIDS